MNKAITDGVQLMPPQFALGLSNWSSGNGTPGSDSYQGAANAAFVAADSDFGGCLELQKTTSLQKLRSMIQTPLIPGCYLQVRARIKVLSGALPSVRIAAWAGASGGGHLGGVVETGAATSLSTYGEVVEISAIIGTGLRGGVDMAWGREAGFAHVGLDLTGPNGGVVRIDDIVVEDVTGVFLRDMISLVDVRDFGAVGDGSTDNTAAFEAADAAAAGRRILIPAGEFYLADTVTLTHPVEVQGTVRMPTNRMLLLTRSFDFPTYAAIFGEEELGFKKAFQALLNNADHESLDLCGRKVRLSGPVDMQAAVPNKTSYATRRVIRNGQLEAASSAAWDTDVMSAQASYSASNSRKLTNVANIANIPVGALVEGAGVGREIYVRDKNIGAQELTLTAPLFDAEGTQVFTFRDFKYMLDFSGFSALSKFGMTEVELQCEGRCSALRLAPAGTVFSLDHCFISRPKDRGITSVGSGCQGMLVDNCQFLSDEEPLDVADRTSIALNVNANDAKLRNNRATKFRHFALLGGQNQTVTGNHFFQGDTIADGIRTAGLILTSTNCASTVSDNYIDNCFVEWTNERDARPDFSSGFSFSALSITDNVFLSGDVAPWFSYIVVKPFGSGHFLNGMTVSGNKFRSINGSIERAERVDTSFADLDFSRTRDVFYEGNTYHNVSAAVANPLRVEHVQGSVARDWTVDTEDLLPFRGQARGVDAIIALGPIEVSGGADRHALPHATLRVGSRRDQVRLTWPEAVRGTVQLMVRVDR